jgi:hypothetical protein
MRSIKELLLLLVVFMTDEEIDGELDKDGTPYPFWADDNTPWIDTKVFHGMCNTIFKMQELNLITSKEHSALETYFHRYIPHNLDSERGNRAYWWLPVTKEKRIEWLNQQIRKL